MKFICNSEKFVGITLTIVAAILISCSSLFLESAIDMILISIGILLFIFANILMYFASKRNIVLWNNKDDLRYKIMFNYAMLQKIILPLFIFLFIILSIIFYIVSIIMNQGSDITERILIIVFTTMLIYLIYGESFAFKNFGIESFYPTTRFGKRSENIEQYERREFVLNYRDCLSVLIDEELPDCYRKKLIRNYAYDYSKYVVAVISIMLMILAVS